MEKQQVKAKKAILIRVDHQLWRRLRLASVDQEQPMTKIVTRAIKKELETGQQR